MDYYEKFDYAHQWVMAALQGNKTHFENGNADFTKYTNIGKTGMFSMFKNFSSIHASKLTFPISFHFEIRRSNSKGDSMFAYSHVRHSRNGGRY